VIGGVFRFKLQPAGRRLQAFAEHAARGVSAASVSIAGRRLVFRTTLLVAD